MLADERKPKLYAEYCELRESGVTAKTIIDNGRLVGLQRSTAARFERSFKAGALMPIPPNASNPGPASLSARAPKRDRPSKRKALLCSICLQPNELDKHGRCVDRAACEAVMAPMF